MSENIVEDVVEIEPEIVEEAEATQVNEIKETKEIKEIKEIKETKEIPAAKKRGRPAGSTNKAVRMKAPPLLTAPPSSPETSCSRTEHPSTPSGRGGPHQEFDYDLLARTMHAGMETRQIQRHAQRNSLYNSFF